MLRRYEVAADCAFYRALSLLEAAREKMILPNEPNLPGYMSSSHRANYETKGDVPELDG